ncbi:MAG: hypothetical protein ACK4WH_10300 [Phycisphaerales bacterium]
MKKFTVSALCCVAACALGLAGCNKNADTNMSGEKASCAEKSCADKASCADKTSCCKGSAAAKSGCCKDKAAQQN